MNIIGRRTLLTTLLAVAVAPRMLAGLDLGGPLVPEPPVPPDIDPPVGPPGAEPPQVDGFAVTHVPAGAAPAGTTHDYRWDDIEFRSRVWERGPDADGAYTVDLTVKTLRGPALDSPEALLSFLTGYHELDASVWRKFGHPDGPGWSRPGGAQWWVGPGVAVEVTIDIERFPDPVVLDVARGVRPVPVPG